MSSPPRFTIGTLVNKFDLYTAMRASFEAGGFTGDVEWIVIDNTGPVQTDAYAGLNQILNQARGTYVILCHQDLLLLQQGRAELEVLLADLSKADPNWALAGNAGAVGAGHIVLHVTDRNGKEAKKGQTPARVTSLDENFIIVKREARIALSRDLTGFHLYGTDICLVADLLGYNAWVIDFHLQHVGEGIMGPVFTASENEFRRKWNHALRDRHLQTTCTFVSLSSADQPSWKTALQGRVALRAGRLQRSIVKRLTRST
jgi:hypothetical protein